MQFSGSYRKLKHNVSSMTDEHNSKIPISENVDGSHGQKAKSGERQFNAYMDCCFSFGLSMNAITPQ